MRIFISAGEPSGDLHGANLIRELRRLRPDVEFVGFGGDRMAEAGARLLYPLCQLAVMWFLRVFTKLALFIRLTWRADRCFREEQPDAVVLIDFPGFHWGLAKRAHARGIPVYYFVPPQLWAWAGWRVKKMRRWVDQILCSLPFEPDWYAARGVRARYIGHPYFDELARQRPDPAFLAEQLARPGVVIALLPGSRLQEVTHNWPTMRRAAEILHAARPDVRFLVACFNAEQEALIRADLPAEAVPLEAHVGRTPEIIELARACVAVSGSVGLELLAKARPTVVLYRIARYALVIAGWFIKCRFISLVNLLAGKELFPEFLTWRDEAPAVAATVRRWLDDPAAEAGLVRELTDLRRRVAEPGACARAAALIIEELERRAERRAA